MSAAADLFGLAQQYLRMIAIGRLLSRLPLRLAYVLAVRAAFRFGPLRDRFEHFAAYARAIGCPESRLVGEWHNATACHGIFFVNTFLHARHPDRIRRRVKTCDPAWAALLAEPNGALVLTCHHEFHHTLFVLAGLAGRRVSVIAAPEDSSPLSPWLEPHIRRSNEDCVSRFNGGSYLFIGDPQTLGRNLGRALKRGETVFSLHDFPSTGMRNRQATLFGRDYQAPSGSIELALRLGKPIYFAMLVWSPTEFCYHLRASRLHVAPDRPLDAYNHALESIVRQQPSAWQGWQWFENFQADPKPSQPVP